MNYYFQLHFIRLHRFLKDFGIHPVLSVLAGIVALVVGTEYLYTKSEYANYFLVFIGLSLTSVLNKSDRIDFIKSIYSDSIFRKIRTIENALITIPFCVSLLVHSEFIAAFILITISTISAILSSRSDITIKLPTPFFKFPFEFIIGFRKTFWTLFFTSFLIYKAIEVNNFNLSIIALFINTLVLLGFYTHQEDDYYVWNYALTSRQFIHKKIGHLICCTTKIISGKYKPINTIGMS